MNEYTSERINHTFDTNEMDLVLVTVNKGFFFFYPFFIRNGMEVQEVNYITGPILFDEIAHNRFRFIGGVSVDAIRFWKLLNLYECHQNLQSQLH